jgi:hypothetical protein
LDFLNLSKHSKIKNLINLGILLCFFSLPAVSWGEIRPANIKQFNGRTIRKIIVKVEPIFNEEPLSLPYKGINALKIATKDSVIRREIIISEGAVFNDFAINESARNLRTQRFLREIKIEVKPRGDAEVDVIISAQDAWTLVPQVGLSSSGGQDKKSFGVADSNVLGYGKRIEVLKKTVDERETIETIWEDPRLFGSYTNFLTAYADRNDGREFALAIGQPFRSLLNKTSWEFAFDDAELVGRLFADDEETYIYQTSIRNIKARYIFALGEPEKLIRRITVGFDSQSQNFSQADLGDYEALNLDPEKVGNDASLLAEERVYRGFIFGYNSISPDFVSQNYIDRFDRVEDYNIGAQRSINLFFTPKVFDSTKDAVHLSLTRSGGIKFSEGEFIRSEVGFSNRINSNDFENNLLRGETIYFNVLGPLKMSELFLGRHTLAARGFFEYSSNIDDDRQLILGSEAGGLRGYRARSFVGDKRFALNFEDRMFLVENIFNFVSLGAVSFLDLGGASYDSLSTLIRNDTYADVGFGLRIGLPRSSGGSVFGIDIAFPIRDSADGTDAFSPRIVFQAGQVFGARLRSETVGVEKTTTSIGFDR